MDMNRLKRLQDRRDKFERVVESLQHLEMLTNIDRVIVRDTTNETSGYIIPIGELIKNYKQEVGEINRLIEHLRMGE
jgi:adenosyl cobinamide kinase/adenosyl cobinamide phosphate guanylyltransferase